MERVFYENWIVLRSLRSFTYHIFLILEVQNEQRRKEMCPVSESKYGNAGGWIKSGRTEK